MRSAGVSLTSINRPRSSGLGMAVYAAVAPISTDGRDSRPARGSPVAFRGRGGTEALAAGAGAAGGRGGGGAIIVGGGGAGGAGGGTAARGATGATGLIGLVHPEAETS